MTVEDVIAALAAAEGSLPIHEVRWAQEHWDEVGPRLIDALARFATCDDDSELSDIDQNLATFALFLGAEKGDTRVFRPLLALLHNEPRVDGVMSVEGNAHLHGILIQCFDGDVHALKAFVLNADASSFARGSILMFLAWLTRQGRIPRQEMHAWLQQAPEFLQPEAESWVWVDWASAVAALGYSDLVPLVESIFQRNYIPPWAMTPEEFRSGLDQSLHEATRSKLFLEDGFVPLTDAVPALSTLAFFTDVAADEDEADVEWNPEDEADLNLPGPEEQRFNPYRNVGRNDPCPCGSGKKFKRCCLRIV